MNQQHVQRSIKPAPSLLPNVDLRTKMMQIFTINARAI